MNVPKITFKANAQKLQEGLLVKAGSRGFSIMLDEPAEFGGSDKGISPGEMLLASCGSCLCMVMTAFARKNRIAIEDLRIDVEGDMDLLGYLNGGPDPRPGFQAIRCIVHLKTPASPEKVRKFIEFAEKRCPVADTVVNGTKVIASLTSEYNPGS